MNDNLETIQYLAQAEAKHFAPLRADVLSTDDDIPHLVVEKRQCPGSYDVWMRGHIGHDNEARAPLICSFVQNTLTNLDYDLDASGAYPIELHDSYTYLPSRSSHKYRGALTFSKDMGDSRTILFPDPYQIQAYGGTLGTSDSIEFDKKHDVVVFAGTTTGARNPAENERIRACLWAKDKRPDYQFYITKIAQMTSEDMLSVMPRADYDAIVRPPIPPQEQFACKYIFNIRGNTCCWSRVPMALNSKSLLLNLAHPDGTWYYPLLQDRTHFISVPTLDMLPSVVQHCRANPDMCKHVTRNASEFVKRFCGQVHAAYYAKCLFEALVRNK